LLCHISPWGRRLACQNHPSALSVFHPC
jgi:hypothetical protein